MGNCNNTKENPQEEVRLPTKNDYNMLYVIGRGGFGKVYRVECKGSKQQFALKEMSKCKFIVNMRKAFQDKEYLYLVMDLLQGGDLRYHFCKQRKFTEQQTKFFIASVLLSLEYMHKNTIIHRDIKPENLVFDNDGYLRLTDMGIARIWRPDNSNDTSGTPGYMAPEVMCRQNHGVASDYFAVGVIAYECMNGKRPYLGKTRREIRDQILAKQVQIKKNQIPDGWSEEAADFINKMIQRKPGNRLGLNGPDEVKNHSWFNKFDWDALLNKQMTAPYSINCNQDNFDQKFVNMKDEYEMDAEILGQNQIMLRRNSIQELFYQYTYYSQQSQITQPLQSQNAKFENSKGSTSNTTVMKETINKSNTKKITSSQNILKDKEKDAESQASYIRKLNLLIAPNSSRSSKPDSRATPESARNQTCQIQLTQKNGPMSTTNKNSGQFKFK